MNARNIVSAGVAILGFYSLYTIVASLTSFLYLFQGELQWTPIVANALMLIVVAWISYLLIYNSSAIAGWLLRNAKVENNGEVGSLSAEGISPVLFSLLGLYLLYRSVADMAYFVIEFIKENTAPVSWHTATSTSIAESIGLANIVYYVVSLAFACFVFFKAPQISKFIWERQKRFANRNTNPEE